MVTEKKKIIFIAVIIGLFLFIAIALPLTLLSSNEKLNAAAVSGGIPKPPPQTQITEPDALKPVTPDTLSVTPPPTQSNAQNVIINQYGAEGLIEPSGTKVVSNPDGGTLTINVLPAVPAQQPPSTVAQQPPVNTPPRQTVAPEPKPAPKTPAAQPKAVAPVAPKTPPKQTTAPAETKKPSQTAGKTTTNYWIQTGAFKTSSKQVKAEDLKKALIDHGIKDASIRIVPYSDFFRVRVGPYSKAEADQWLKLIKIMDIDGLKDSWIDRE